MTNLSARTTFWIAIGLFAITLVTRLPFVSQYLYHWDSVNMAFGLRQFDVQAGAPQYPGYIVYVLLGQLLNAFIHNEQTTLVLISIISSGVAAVAIFCLGWELFHPATGLLAAAFLISSPLVWFYGEVALPHTVDLFIITLVLWLLYRIMRGERYLLWFTAVLLALSGGIRQQDLLFLGPVMLLALWGVGLARIIIFGIIGAAVSLAWFIPLVQNPGGLQAYMAGSSAYSDAFFSSSSLLHGAGIAGLRRNILSKLIPYTLYAGSLALLPAIIYWGTQIPRRWRIWLKDRKVWFVALSISPALAFYAFIHMGQQGLVFVFMPMLFVLSAEGLRRLITHPVYLSLVAAGISLVGAGIFVLAPVYPLGAGGLKLLSYDTIREHDRQVQDLINTIQMHFEPINTVLLAVNWRHIQYYLPEYYLRPAAVEDGEASVDFPRMSADPATLGGNTLWYVVILDPEVYAHVTTPLEVLATASNPPIGYVTLKPDETFRYENGTFRVEPNGAS